jgi:hypothetical protein
MWGRIRLRASAAALFGAFTAVYFVHGGTVVAHALIDAPIAPEAPIGSSTSTSLFQPTAESACANAGGTYLGDFKCQMPDGSIQQIRSAFVGPNQRVSEIPVPPASPQAWALATTAIMFELNGARHDLLGGAVAFPGEVESAMRLLSQWWGVDTRDELLGELKWLQFEGHRADFEALGRVVDAMSEEQFKAAEAAIMADPQQLYSLQVVRKNHRSLGEQGILGWDLVRFIALCRWGFLAGYLSQQEAWDRIMPAARRLQETFRSWDDLQSNYLIGREYWSLEQTQKNGERYRSIFERLSHEQNSPWNMNPWSMSLGVAMPLSLTPN